MACLSCAGINATSLNSTLVSFSFKPVILYFKQDQTIKSVSWLSVVSHVAGISAYASDIIRKTG